MTILKAIARNHVSCIFSVWWSEEKDIKVEGMGWSFITITAVDINVLLTHKHGFTLFCSANTYMVGVIS